MSRIWTFDHIENKRTLYREKGCMRKFCSSLREHAKFECLEENTEMLKPFSVAIEKEVTKIDKDANESVVTISYKKKFY